MQKGSNDSKLKDSDLSQATGEVNLFSFLDYRHYLKTVFEQLKSTKPYFSYRYFARLAGFGGQSYLQMVMEGKRNLTPDSINKCARALKLNKKQVNYFEALVLYNQSKSEVDRDRYFTQLLSLRPRIEIKGLEKDQYEYVTQSHIVIIREMTALPDFQETPQWIADNLVKKLSATEIKHALDVLERLQLVVRNNDGELRHSGTTLQSQVDVESLAIWNYHRQILSESKDQMLQAPHGESDIASITIPIPKGALPKVLDLLQHCREEIAQLVNASNKDYHEVYQINMQMFPVTKTKKKNSAAVLSEAKDKKRGQS